VGARWALERSAEQIAAAVEMLLDHPCLVIQDADVVASALELFRRRPSLGLSDCLIVGIARKAGPTPVGTFDRRLAKVEGVSSL
jgi:predicted nucleic-acid-binding protein